MPNIFLNGNKLKKYILIRIKNFKIHFRFFDDFVFFVEDKRVILSIPLKDDMHWDLKNYT